MLAEEIPDQPRGVDVARGRAERVRRPWLGAGPIVPPAIDYDELRVRTGGTGPHEALRIGADLLRNGLQLTAAADG